MSVNNIIDIDLRVRLRFRFSEKITGVTAEAASKSGVEEVAQGVTEHISAIDDDTEGEAWEDRHPGSLNHIAAGAPAEHTAPAGSRGRDTVAEEADTGFGEDSAAEAHRKHDNERGHDIGEDMF